MYQNNSNKNFKRNDDRPRNETFEFSFVPMFTSTKGEELDAVSVMSFVGDLDESGVFKKLSYPVQIAAALIAPPATRNDGTPVVRKGTRNVGYVKTVDPSASTMTVVVYAVHAESIKKMLETKSLWVKPRIATDKDGKIRTVLSFDLVVAE